MGAYEPKYLFGEQINATASAAITGGQQLVVSGNGTVAPAGGASAAHVGTAAMDAATNGRLSYFPRGKVHVSTASGAITAGDQLVTAAAGKVSSLAAASGAVAADINSARSVIGVALTTAADTASVEWMEF